MSAAAPRTEQEPAFVLHTHAYRETSLIVDMFTRNHGRIPMVARGARRRQSPQRAALLSFQPLHVSWFGKSEVRTLAKVEWAGGMPLPRGNALLCGYYLNELLIRLLPRDDPHPKLYDCYQESLTDIVHHRPEQVALRRFERNLLAEIGYAPVLDQEASGGARVEPQLTYAYQPGRGPVRWSYAPEGETGGGIHGQTLIDLARDDFSNPRTLYEAKLLMRKLIAHYVGDRPLLSRRVVQELHDL